MKLIQIINNIKPKRRNRSSSNNKHRVICAELRSVTQDANDLEQSSPHSRSVSIQGRIDQDYHVALKEMGRGVDGSVYSTLHRKTGQVFAVKSIEKAKVKRIYRIRREITFLREVDHPNIIRAHAVYEDNRKIHIVTDMCHGGELFDLIVEKASSGQGCFPERDVARIVSQLLSAVKYLHSMDIVHRDIKPENILFVEKNDDMSPIKLIDFGFSVRHPEGSPKLTSTAGTSYYMAPEILGGSYDRSCDLWSVGVIAYLMLCGRPPFDGSTDDDILASVRRGEYDMSSVQWRGISDDAKDFVRNLLRADPTKRLTAAEALGHSWLTEDRSTTIGDEV